MPGTSSDAPAPSKTLDCRTSGTEAGIYQIWGSTGSCLPLLLFIRAVLCRGALLLAALCTPNKWGCCFSTVRTEKDDLLNACCMPQGVSNRRSLALSLFPPGCSTQHCTRDMFLPLLAAASQGHAACPRLKPLTERCRHGTALPCATAPLAPSLWGDCFAVGVFVG